jgi:hypothetical protein
MLKRDCNQTIDSPSHEHHGRSGQIQLVGFNDSMALMLLVVGTIYLRYDLEFPDFSREEL